MIRASRLPFVVILLLACGGLPSEPRSEDLIATGTASVIGVDAERVLRLEVTIRNRSARNVAYMAPYSCPIVLILERPAAAGGDRVLDETQGGCTLAGEGVELAPAQARIWTRDHAIAWLHRDGVPAGRYVVKAMVFAPDGRIIELGEVSF